MIALAITQIFPFLAYYFDAIAASYCLHGGTLLSRYDSAKSMTFRFRSRLR